MINNMENKWILNTMVSYNLWSLIIHLKHMVVKNDY